MNEEEFWAALQPVEPAPIFYRLYYDTHGCPLFYSMEDHPGNYIEIDANTYAQSSNHIRVQDGKIVPATVQTKPKLMPVGYGIACSLADVCLVVDESAPNIKWSLKVYE